MQKLKNIIKTPKKPASIWRHLAFITSLEQYVAQVKFLIYSKYYILHCIIIYLRRMALNTAGVDLRPHLLQFSNKIRVITLIAVNFHAPISDCHQRILKHRRELFFRK
jgi:hypothetical protein